MDIRCWTICAAGAISATSPTPVPRRFTGSRQYTDGGGAFEGVGAWARARAQSASRRDVPAQVTGGPPFCTSPVLSLVTSRSPRPSTPAGHPVVPLATSHLGLRAVLASPSLASTRSCFCASDKTDSSATQSAVPATTAATPSRERYLDTVSGEEIPPAARMRGEALGSGRRASTESSKVESGAPLLKSAPWPPDSVPGVGARSARSRT